MRQSTIQNMQHFVGKICSIFMPPINRNFDEERAREHFVVRVQEASDDGIWATAPFGVTVSFFPMRHIVLIQEELELNPQNPEHAKFIKQYQKATGSKLESDLKISQKNETPPPEPESDEGGTFIDIEKLTKLASDTKKAYESI